MGFNSSGNFNWGEIWKFVEHDEWSLKNIWNDCCHNFLRPLLSFINRPRAPPRDLSRAQSRKRARKIAWLSVNYEKWANIRLTLKTLTSSIMINELFIKIPSTIKLYNISHFHLAPIPTAFALKSIKYFMCEKYGNEWKTAEFCNSIFILCRAIAGFGGGEKNVRFRICQPSQSVHVCSDGDGTTWKSVMCWARQNPFSMFGIDFSSTKLFSFTKKMNYSLLHRMEINLKNAFFIAYNTHFFLLLFWLLFACQCGCLLKFQICLMVFEQLSKANNSITIACVPGLFRRWHWTSI